MCCLPQFLQVHIGNGRVLFNESTQSASETTVSARGRHFQNARAANCLICEGAISFDSIKHGAVTIFQIGVLRAMLPQDQGFQRTGASVLQIKNICFVVTQTPSS
jgi:hypothetical protein